jgi:hypothetical protein
MLILIEDATNPRPAISGARDPSMPLQLLQLPIKVCHMLSIQLEKEQKVSLSSC